MIGMIGMIGMIIGNYAWFLWYYWDDDWDDSWFTRPGKRLHGAHWKITESFCV